ncbi:MAG: YggS family pyridoxal phosphate-dependent enzyme [Clostridia bacterium]|nr:YggS family pyridoxal phosphate-dependent enzyme [Clostridia bacterium]
MNEIFENLNKIKNLIKDTNVKLIGVSKTKPVSVLKQAYDAGLRDFGENRVQELVAKIDELPNDIRWHMIGHLQTNKVKILLEKEIYLIHSVDSLNLASIIDKYSKLKNKTQNILLEVNVTGEQSKTGYSKDKIIEDMPDLLKLKNIRILGLMCVAKKDEDSTKYFKELKNILKDINTKFKINLKELSMGMTDDYMRAIECGSTYIRIGRAIFGERD